MSRWLRLFLRLALGAIFVYAAWTKLRDPWQMFASAVAAYDLLPMWAVKFVARVLPRAELLIGLLLLSGRFLRVASIVASALLLGFFAVMVRTYASGIQIECGCFGPGDVISPRSLARDGSLLLASLCLAGLAIWNGRRPSTAPPA
jgi:uncharacterized membrane protein YphA (DoxX/SURF4 family)